MIEGETIKDRGKKNRILRQWIKYIQGSSFLSNWVVNYWQWSRSRGQSVTGLSPGATEDPPCRVGRCTLNLSRLKHPSVGVV
ncbi:hypothetical protein TNCV_4001931 [Trichonephila clavipes]|uniref:Uncharacterized protein n=1 Tax=Trichonephila clavipes TaxID=2585209 RepID=A0A8X6RT74_TRICX|nr:hypothetical protein TNCV_4001931 [Trichonephila clavipes]